MKSQVSKNRTKLKSTLIDLKPKKVFGLKNEMLFSLLNKAINIYKENFIRQKVLVMT